MAGDVPAFTQDTQLFHRQQKRTHEKESARNSMVSLKKKVPRSSQANVPGIKMS
jgi:hypothetical protein